MVNDSGNCSNELVVASTQTVLIMSVGMVMVVPVDLGVQDSLRGFLGSNFSEESGLEAGDVDVVEEKEGVWIMDIERSRY